MSAIWSLVPLPFLNLAWTSGSSRFMYCWSLAWRILDIILLACEISQTERQIIYDVTYLGTVLIPHTSKVTLKIFQARLQQDMNQELPDVQAGYRKGRGTQDQIVNICWIIEKAREFWKTSTSASLTTLKPLTVWITTNWKILKEMGIPDHLTCLPRNLYAGEGATVRTRHGTMN